ENVKEKQTAGKEAVADKVDELKTKAADAKVQGEKALEDLKENVKEKQAAAKEAVEDKANDLKGKLDDAQHSLQDKFDHLRTEAAHK
ncbi:hypothetical protein, partial [Escherichia coli]|uniref:hypothetical protein n=12 Tax=Gammaproteobacteria TaxID=1236 RepID=UPI0019533EED